MELGTKAVEYSGQQNFSRNVGGTEQHLLCLLLYAGTFAH
jgi:hypothetical protein